MVTSPTLKALNIKYIVFEHKIFALLYDRPLLLSMLMKCDDLLV